MLDITGELPPRPDRNSRQTSALPAQKPPSRVGPAQLVSQQDAHTYYIATIAGIAVGAVAFFAGFILALMGLTGSIELMVETGGLKSRLSNASPGVVFALLGMIVLWRYKPRIRSNVASTEEARTDSSEATTSSSAGASTTEQRKDSTGSKIVYRDSSER